MALDWNLSDHEYLLYIKEHWDMAQDSDITVISNSSHFKTITDEYGSRFSFFNAIYHPVSNAQLEYPIKGIEKISEKGIYVPNQLAEIASSSQPYEILQITLELSPKFERIKHKNAILLRVNRIIKAEIINSEVCIYNSDGKILVDKTLINYLEKKYSADLQNRITKKEEELSSLEEEISKTLIDINIKENTLSELKTSVSNKRSVIKELEEEEYQMNNQLQKLQALLDQKKEELVLLGFIDREIVAGDISNHPSISFTHDLSSDYDKLASHIQAYLYNDNKYYSKDTIKDFLALVMTNDLVILSGDSGSGKTSLISSFAEVLGGKCIVLPVKPNWTGAEDLLGYYNPIEQKFLPTAFTEALIEANNNPETLYFICLDEMNLARIEYYFADFLSLLENRKSQPEIRFYSDDTAQHIAAETQALLEFIKVIKDKYPKNTTFSFVQLMQDVDMSSELCRILGITNQETLIGYYMHIRKMLSGVRNTPSSIKFPKNVRIFGAINIDETTHFLSTKILDRVHIMKFENPLLNDMEALESEILSTENSDKTVKININDLGERTEYPPYELNDLFCSSIVEIAQQFLIPLGIEFGFRGIRQGSNYSKILSNMGYEMPEILDRFLLHKVLPKLNFDGSLVVDGRKKIDILSDFKEYTIQQESELISLELDMLIERAHSNNDIVNYWAK